MHLFPPYPSEKELKKVNDNYGLCVICTRNLNLNLQNLIIFLWLTDFAGEKFALISGTSMATPHIAGIVTLIKQRHPTWSPSAIHSALLTTASNIDFWNNPILAEQPSANPSSSPSGSASPFDVGCGAVNATAALDPGLVFERGEHIILVLERFWNRHGY